MRSLMKLFFGKLLSGDEIERVARPDDGWEAKPPRTAMPPFSFRAANEARNEHSERDSERIRKQDD